MFRRNSTKNGAAPITSAPATHRDLLPCSERECGSCEAVPCAYVDRRQRECDTAWCPEHQQIVFDNAYCGRHARIIEAIGPLWATQVLPDLENRAPSLANWVGGHLDTPIRELLERYVGSRKLSVSTVGPGGWLRDRTWGNSWKLVSAQGVDLSINVTVPEADENLVRVMYNAAPLLELVPPWIEAHRRGIPLDPATDQEARQRFYGLILDKLEEAMQDTKRTPWRPAAPRARRRHPEPPVTVPSQVCPAAGDAATHSEEQVTEESFYYLEYDRGTEKRAPLAAARRHLPDATDRGAAATPRPMSISDELMSYNEWPSRLVEQFHERDEDRV